jgi:hypothetical protein
MLANRCLLATNRPSSKDQVGLQVGGLRKRQETDDNNSAYGLWELGRNLGGWCSGLDQQEF